MGHLGGSNPPPPPCTHGIINVRVSQFCHTGLNPGCAIVKYIVKIIQPTFMSNFVSFMGQYGLNNLFPTNGTTVGSMNTLTVRF